jgi:hypothetical protein
LNLRISAVMKQYAHGHFWNWDEASGKYVNKLSNGSVPNRLPVPRCPVTYIRFTSPGEASEYTSTILSLCHFVILFPLKFYR